MTVAAASNGELESRLAAVEDRLALLGNALRTRDTAGIDTHAAELHRALAVAVGHFAHAARSGGGIEPSLKSRLARASGQVAAQRESLARATAALDRAIDVLLPRDGIALYAAHGGSDRGHFASGVLSA